MNSSHLLGATMYIPAVHRDVAQILRGEKHTSLRSMVFCTEDSIAEGQVPMALANLAAAFRADWPEGQLRFLRPRNIEVLGRLLELEGIEKVDGFVLPKATRRNLPAYFRAIERLPRARVMVTLETREAFDREEMLLLRQLLLEDAYFPRILALRIGGNDLLSLLGIRRPSDRTIYRTPLGPVIGQLVTTFKPYGFQMTAPVFEYLNLPKLLQEEVKEDLAHGLFGKTAIHPRQIAVIESLYRVEARDLETARMLLAEGAPATFRAQDSMCEVATHRSWAVSTLERAEVFGLT